MRIHLNDLHKDAEDAKAAAAAAKRVLAEGGVGSWGAIGQAVDYVAAEYAARLATITADMHLEEDGEDETEPLLRVAITHAQVERDVRGWYGSRSSSAAANLDEEQKHLVDLAYLRAVEEMHQPSIIEVRARYEQFRTERDETNRALREAANAEQVRVNGVPEHPTTGRKVTSLGVRKVLKDADIGFASAAQARYASYDVLVADGHPTCVDVWFQTRRKMNETDEALAVRACAGLAAAVIALAAAGYAVPVKSQTTDWAGLARARVSGWVVPE